MAKNSKISWCDNTFNGWIGCTEVAEGCEHCYAKYLSARMNWAEWGDDKPRYRTSAANWKKPLTWDRAAKKEGKRIRNFAFSLSDVFDVRVPFQWLVDFGQLVNGTTHTDWLILTKRFTIPKKHPNVFDWSKVWLGYSVAGQEDLHGFDHIADIPSKYRWISYEPAIGPVDFEPVLKTGQLNWIVVGGESNQYDSGKLVPARAFDVSWAYSVIAQCRKYKVPVFVKQLGSRPYRSPQHKKATGYNISLKDGHGADPWEWPEDLWVQEFPDEEF